MDGRLQGRSCIADSRKGSGTTVSFFDAVGKPRFDSDFDDRRFWMGALTKPLVQVPEEAHGKGYRVDKRVAETCEVFGKLFALSEPMEARVLLDSRGQVWMSDLPQERMMMCANATRARGSTLVGGLGLGMFPQYAQRGCVGNATRFTVVEANPEVIALVEPVLRDSLQVPCRVLHSTIEHYLADSSEKFDTIFLDTWEVLEPKQLPKVNSLRDEAVLHLRRGGSVLLWGYRWMVELFSDACMRLFTESRSRREEMLRALAIRDEESAAVLRECNSSFHEHSSIGREELRRQCEAIATRIVTKENTDRPFT
jgi:hypothetical protein